jgi:hypothetical protein
MGTTFNVGDVVFIQKNRSRYKNDRGYIDGYYYIVSIDFNDERLSCDRDCYCFASNDNTNFIYIDDAKRGFVKVLKI